MVRPVRSSRLKRYGGLEKTRPYAMPPTPGTTVGRRKITSSASSPVRRRKTRFTQSNTGQRDDCDHCLPTVSYTHLDVYKRQIYGFAHADPKKLETLIASTTGATLELNENWRSSQALCDVTYQFSGRSKPDVAVAVSYTHLDVYKRQALDGARDRAALHLHCQLPAIGQPRARYLGGDAKSPDVEEWARSAITYTYLPPLRDAEEDLRPGRNNRLIELIAALTGDGADRQRILDIAGQANNELAGVQSLVESRSRIQARLNSLAGATQSQQAALLFTEPLFERVLSTLGVSVGDDLPLAMSQNGLGMNNILYMAVLLAALTYDLSLIHI